VSALGRGKAILLGEHAVVYGVPAIAAGLRRGVVAEARPAAQPVLRCAPWGTAHGPESDEDLGRALRAVIEAHPAAPLPALAIDATVELPAGAGLGCSAAIGVAVVRALDAAVGHEASDAEVAERSLDWERVFHGNPSGLDNTMAAHGGIAVYVRGEPLERLDVRRPLRLVIGNTDEASSTREMVAMVARHRERDPGQFEANLRAIETLVRNARLAIEASDAKAVGQLMDLNQALLSAWMLSTPAIEELCAAAREAGARGAKLTGAGGGGCMIALVDSDEVTAAVIAAIEKLGFEAFEAEAG